MPSFKLALREKIVGVIPPPPGVTPDFDDPPSVQHVMLTANIVLSIISVVFVVLRFYTTCFIIRSVGVDDFLIALSWVLGCVASALDILLIRYGLGRHLWDVPFSTFNGNFLKITVIGGTFYTLSIMCSKVSILVLFLRWVPRKPKKTIYATIIIVVLYSLIGSFHWLFACQPIEKFWDLTITRGSCINWAYFYIFSGVMNTATDCVILLLPIFMLRNVRLPMWERIGLVVILMTGGFVLTISAVRLGKTMDLARNPDITWVYVHDGIWWFLEMHITIICACLPVGRAFLRKHFPRVVNYTFDNIVHSTQKN